MHLSKSVSALVAMLAFSNAAWAKDDASVAWLRDGKVEMRMLAIDGKAAAADPAAVKVPLGSLWKLFVYAYLAETQAAEKPYACVQKQISAHDEDRYCCMPGESIGRDQALSRSCAPYFSPQRLGISNGNWRARWQGSTSAPWLLDIKRLQPDTQVPLSELLEALGKMPPAVRTEARHAMLETAIKGYGRESWPVLGTGMRYKTFSWHRADGSAFGGAAGWLADGTPFWFGASGSSSTALTTWSTQLAAALPEARWQSVPIATEDVSCVDVDFFERYPIKDVWQATGSSKAQPGILKGSYRVQFANGHWLVFISNGELTLNPGTTPTISGRFTVNEYVARVLEREGSAQPPQAARALAIAIRSYLVQNARFEAGCWHIADTSRTQRVSPNPPGSAALAIAWFSDDIVLNGAPVQYHQDAPGKNRLAWRMAVKHAGEGWDFERILGEAFPSASIASLNGRQECSRLNAAETWLTQASHAWQKRLQREPGYEALDGTPKICTLFDGNPYSDQRRLRIYARGWRSLNERITLAHEYLHLVFRFHPNGADEAYVERLARQLVEG